MASLNHGKCTHCFQPRTQKPISIEIVGGLGNQLFGLTAGLYLANFLNTNLRVLHRNSYKSETKHLSSINSLETGHDAISQKMDLEFLSVKLRVFTRKILLRLGVPQTLSEKLCRVHISNVLGLDRDLEFVKNGFYVSGYFQTYKYLESLRENKIMPSLLIRNPSNWFIETSQRLTATNPIVVHVRRGDYLSKENDFIGVLSLEYYLEAITYFQKRRI